MSTCPSAMVLFGSAAARRTPGARSTYRDQAGWSSTRQTESSAIATLFGSAWHARRNKRYRCQAPTGAKQMMNLAWRSPLTSRRRTASRHEPAFEIIRFIAYIKDELLIVLGTSSSETVLPQMSHCGLPQWSDVLGIGRHFAKVPTAEEHHSHCGASQRGIYWRPSAVIEGGRYEPRAVNSGRQSSLRSGASRSACRAPRLSYHGVAALADAERAVAQPHQYHRHFLRFGRPHEAVLAGPERGSESEARRNLCSQASAASSGDQRWHQVAHVPGSTRYR